MKYISLWRNFVRNCTYFRKRNYFLVGGSFLVIMFLYFTDPNNGALTAMFIQQLTTPIVAVWFAYLARTALFDYLDMQELYEKAKKSAIGSAITFVGVCIVFFGLLGLFGSGAKAAEVTTYIPSKAQVYLPIVKAEQQTLWVDHPKTIL